MPGTTEDTQHLIELCLNELLQNVFEWSGTKHGCFVQTRWHAEKKNVRLAVVDAGIGIPAALRSKEIAGLHTKKDSEVVIAAVTRRGISSRTGRPGGLGLKLLWELATERGGALTVVSSATKVVFKPGRRPQVRKRRLLNELTAARARERNGPEKDPPSAIDK